MYRPRSWLRSTKPRSPCAFANFPTATVVPLIATPNSISALYKKLWMFVHAESRGASDGLQNGDLHMFVRLGTDLERQLLRIRYSARRNALGSYRVIRFGRKRTTWRSRLNKLVQAKLARNNAMQVNGTVTLRTPFSVQDGDRTITIKGSPNLSNVRSLMIGVRNPKDPLGDRKAEIVRGSLGERIALVRLRQNGGWQPPHASMRSWPISET